jgi:hypothetical protein
VPIFIPIGTNPADSSIVVNTPVGEIVAEKCRVQSENLVPVLYEPDFAYTSTHVSIPTTPEPGSQKRLMSSFESVISSVVVISNITPPLEAA